MPTDTFTLYDLRVEVVATDRPMVCNHRPGDWFELSGENLTFGQINGLIAEAAKIRLPRMSMPDALAFGMAAFLTGLASISRRPPTRSAGQEPSQRCDLECGK